MLTETYDTERAAFGDHWVGPNDYLMTHEWELVARYPKNPGNGDGHEVEVYVMAMPARFYKVVALAGCNSVGNVNPGFVLNTGSGMAEWAARTAELISQGMVGFEAYFKVSEVFE